MDLVIAALSKRVSVISKSGFFRPKADPPEFNLQLPLAPTGAPLLPKLRGQFAEFLNGESHERLRILIPPTCVGLRYARR